MHFGDWPNTFPHEDRTQRKEVEKEGGKEAQRRRREERGEGRRVEKEGRGEREKIIGERDCRGRGGR